MSTKDSTIKGNLTIPVFVVFGITPKLQFVVLDHNKSAPPLVKSLFWADKIDVIKSKIIAM